MLPLYLQAVTKTHKKAFARDESKQGMMILGILVEPVVDVNRFCISWWIKPRCKMSDGDLMRSRRRIRYVSQRRHGQAGAADSTRVPA
mgnify:CR=1 FL=1